MTILVPSSAIATIVSSITWVAAGSRLAVGSSRKSTCGRKAQERASASRCCSPKESTRAGVLAKAPRPVRSSASAIRRRRSGRAMPRKERAKAILAATERRSITGRCITIAWKRRGSRPCAPRHSTVPSLGWMRPWQRRRSRLLPAPLGPRTMVFGPPSRRAETAFSSRWRPPSTLAPRSSRGRIVGCSRVTAAPAPGCRATGRRRRSPRSRGSRGRGPAPGRGRDRPSRPPGRWPSS